MGREGFVSVLETVQHEDFTDVSEMGRFVAFLVGRGIKGISLPSTMDVYSFSEDKALLVDGFILGKKYCLKEDELRKELGFGSKFGARVFGDTKEFETLPLNQQIDGVDNIVAVDGMRWADESGQSGAVGILIVLTTIKLPKETWGELGKDHVKLVYSVFMREDLIREFLGEILK